MSVVGPVLVCGIGFKAVQRITQQYVLGFLRGCPIGFGHKGNVKVDASMKQCKRQMFLII